MIGLTCSDPAPASTDIAYGPQGTPTLGRNIIGLWGPTFCPEPAKKTLQKPQQLGSPVIQERKAASASMFCIAQGRREERER